MNKESCDSERLGLYKTLSEAMYSSGPPENAISGVATLEAPVWLVQDRIDDIETQLLNEVWAMAVEQAPTRILQRYATNA